MLRVLLGGSRSMFTSIVLRELLSAGMPLVGLMLHRARVEGAPSSGGVLRVTSAADVEAVARSRRIPLIELERGSEHLAVEAVECRSPDVLALACYPHILDKKWLSLAPCGAFNLHPSLLPAYRGPTPLFWQFRNGEKRMGVTLHRVVAEVDAGPVVAAAAIQIAPGAGAGEVQDALVRRGAALLVDALGCIEAGTLQETPQDESRASRFALPDESAFRIPTSWSAERAFRFMRGVREWGRPFTVDTGHETLLVDGALDFDSRGGCEGTVRRTGRVASVGFSAGTLRVRCSFASGGRRPG